MPLSHQWCYIQLHVLWHNNAEIRDAIIIANQHCLVPENIHTSPNKKHFFFRPGPLPSLDQALQNGLQGRIQDFFRRGCTRLLLYFNTNKQKHCFNFFFCRIPAVLENRRSCISRGGGGGPPPAHPLHPTPRSTPGLGLEWIPKNQIVLFTQNAW